MLRVGDDDSSCLKRLGVKLYFYTTYGLTIASELALPELLKVEPTDTPDVRILLRPVSEVLEGAEPQHSYFEALGDVCQFSAKGVARYRIEQGCRIFIDRNVSPVPELEATDSAVRLYLLGTALGTILHQRRWLPLHVSAIAAPSGVWAFTGPSGAGKSTLVAWLNYRQNWPLVSDDVAVLKPKDDLPYLYSGPSRLKLWKDALSAIGIKNNGLARDLTRADKYHLYSHQKFQLEPQLLKNLVILDRANKGEPANLKLLQGMEAFKAAMASIYRPELGIQFNSQEQLFSQIADLGEKITVYQYRRPWGLATMDTSLQALIQPMQQPDKLKERAITIKR